MVISLIELSPNREKRTAMLEILSLVENEARANRGCLSSGVYESAEEPRTVLYLERWKSLEELSDHIQSGTYLRLLNAMDLAREAPSVNFYEVSGTKSMELVEALRGEKA